MTLRPLGHVALTAVDRAAGMALVVVTYVTGPLTACVLIRLLTILRTVCFSPFERLIVAATPVPTSDRLSATTATIIPADGRLIGTLRMRCLLLLVDSRQYAQRP